MATLTLELPNLHDKQKEVWNDPARFKILPAGRRWGKSRLGTLKCTVEGIRGQRWWWVWPSYTNGAIGWRMLKRLNFQIPGTISRESERMIMFPGGGYAQIKSADKPDSLRGEGLNGVIIDEAAHIRKLSELWEQALRPALSDRKGDAWFISTPKGFNDFYELSEKAASRPGEWTAFPSFPTHTNPFIDPVEIEIAKLDLPDLVFRQEYMAEFVQLAGALFRREWFSFFDFEPQARYVRCWDLAVSTKTHADYTVGAKVGLMDDGTLVIANVVRGRWEWPQAMRTIIDTAKLDGSQVQQGIEDVGMQKGMYQSLMQEPSLAAHSLRPVQVHKDKITRINPWLARAEQGKVALVRAPWNSAFIDELCAFPEVNHDDQVDAVSGAVSMISSGVSLAEVEDYENQLVATSRWTTVGSPRWKRDVNR